MGVGQALQQKRIDHGENGRVCANRERKREDHRDGKARISPQLANCKPKILIEYFHGNILGDPPLRTLKGLAPERQFFGTACILSTEILRSEKQETMAFLPSETRSLIVRL
jgi:hypothetical protein